MDLHLSDQDPACPIPPSAVHVWVQETASRQENWPATPNILEVQVGTTTSRGGNDIMHVRHFNLHLGRFLSTDPIGGAIGSSQSWNRYSYVNGNPLRLVGPMGLAGEDINGKAGEDINGKAGGCDEDSVAGDKACFKGEIVVTATALPLFSDGLSVSSGWSQQQAQMYILGMMYNDWLDSQRSMNLSASVDGGIMARLTQQPALPTGADVLKAMASFQCDTTWDRVFQNMAKTNGLGLKGPGGFSLYGPRSAAVSIASRAVGSNIPWEVGLPTVKEFIFRGGFRGMAMEGVSFTGGEAGVLTATGIGAEFVLSWPAWQAGVFAGSVINVALTAPCHYGP